MNARRFAFTAWALAGILGSGVAAATAAGYRLNFTDSAPAGLWRITPLDSAGIERGTLVSICPPPLRIVATMRERGYLPVGDCPTTNIAPLVKAVLAIPGDTVTVAPGAALLVNGTLVPDSTPLPAIPAWPAGRYTVQPGEIWVISKYNPRSVDSRYFGPVAVNNVRGQAAPVLVNGDANAIRAHLQGGQGG